MVEKLGPSLLVVSTLLVASCAQKPAVIDSPEPKGPVEAQATVDRAIATTGDLITYRVSVSSIPDYEVEIPEAGAEIAGFRIVDVGQEEPVEKAGRIQQERWYQLRADLVGSYVLPPVEVGYRQIASDAPLGPWQNLVTSEIFVEVESVLPTNGEATDIRGLKPLREVRPPTPWRLILATALGVALVGGGLFWYLRRWARKRDSVPPVPAHELAFASLSRLRGTDFDDPAAVRLFYFQISEVVRGYVESRFGMNATDLTTEEILVNLVSLEDLAAEQNQSLEEFLVDTDQVKFAHREPSRGDIEGTYEKALAFVEATRPVTQPDQQELAA